MEGKNRLKWKIFEEAMKKQGYLGQEKARYKNNKIKFS